MRPRHLLPLALTLSLALLVAPAGADAYVYWNTNSGSIGRANNDGSDADSNFIVGAEGAESIAVDSDHLYYTTNFENEVGELPVARTNLDGGEASLLPESGEGIAAVDAEHIYWRDNFGIGRARLDGSDPEPEFIPVGVELGGIAVYSGFVYWTYYNGGFGEAIGRASLSTKIVEPEYIHFEVPEALGPRAIAVDAQGIFWTMDPGFDSPYAYTIAHAGFGGTAVFNAIPGAIAVPASGLAIEESNLYWFDAEEGFGTSLARAELHGSGATVDRHLIDHVGNGWLAVNSASSPPPPPPPPPPAPPVAPTGTTGTAPGSTPPPTSAPLNSLPKPKLKLNKKVGGATLTLTVPGPGVVTLAGTGIKPLHKTAKVAGPVALVVRPTAKTIKKLKTNGKAKVAAKLTFAPPGGSPSSRVVKLTLKLG